MSTLYKEQHTTDQELDYVEIGEEDTQRDTQQYNQRDIQAARSGWREGRDSGDENERSVGRPVQQGGEYDGDFMSIDQYLIDRREASYVVTVPNDDLEDEGIREGDLVIVERGREAEEGDIILVIQESGCRLISFDAYSANEAYRRSLGSMPVIDAVVTGLVRKYR